MKRASGARGPVRAKGPVRATFLLYGLLVAVVFFYALTTGVGMPEEFPAPDFTLTEIFDGTEVSLSDFRGKPVMIYFYSSW